MNPDMYYSAPHMSAGPAPPPHTVTSNALPHHGHSQPPLLHPGSHQSYYPPSYGQYGGYPQGLASPSAAPPVSNSMSSQNVLPLPSVSTGTNGMGGNFHGSGQDTTGQIAPPGMKPRVTATLWEDEGSLCFQVEARGICVARREDNHMINGTKLLNVAGMTRGRRDGILKSEKVRHVVKIGPMHLKGVWIPFERALDFANKEKITEMLYPLFVHNIGALLYHPTNQTRTNQVMAAAERRKAEQGQLRNGAPPGPPAPGGSLPSIQQHHHHMSLPGPQTPQLQSQSSSGRPPMDRAHTFPTPPTSASSVMGHMGSSENFQWGQQGMSSGQPPSNISIDTSMNSNPTRSMPATPATTPPGGTLQSMPSYPQATQSYDSSRGVYAPPSQHASYAPSNSSPQDRNMYAPQAPYLKSEMGPPTGRPGAPDAAETHDVKPPNGLIQPGESVPHSAGDDEADHEAEYTHGSGSYDTSRNGYNYNTSQVPSMQGDHQHMSSDLTGSPSHQTSSGRATPRTTTTQPYYAQTGYSTPPRVQSQSSLYNVMSHDHRGSTNGTSASDVYASQNSMGAPLQNGYGSQPLMNGTPGALKRGRDDDDSVVDMSKRRKTLDTMAPGFPAMPRPTSTLGHHR